MPPRQTGASCPLNTLETIEIFNDEQRRLAARAITHKGFAGHSTATFSWSGFRYEPSHGRLQRRRSRRSDDSLTMSAPFNATDYICRRSIHCLTACRALSA